MAYHILLGKQIKKLLTEQQLHDESIRNFLEVVSSTYNGFERDKKISEHAFTVSEKEYQEQSTALVDAKEKAEEASKTKSAFLAAMSHELRTPLNGVLGMASLLVETQLTSEQRDYVDTIRGSGDALLVIIDDILNFSKIESGNLLLESHAFDLRQCVENTMDVFSVKAEQKSLDLIFQIDDKIPVQIIGDSRLLRLVLLNLIGNAVKFTQKGEVFVRIGLHHSDINHLELAFHIRDTGIGIPHDKLSRLFKAFSQVDSSATRKYGGTGLGLIISQRIVELMGGAIKVESEPGVGTTFSFNIKSTMNPNSIQEYAPCDTIGCEGKRVLLVDDSATNLTILKTQLEQLALRPAAAVSGRQALEMLTREREVFELVITDMKLSDMDGMKLSQLIRVNHAQLPIILLGSMSDEDKKKYQELFIAELSKPVNQQQLCDAIQSALRPKELSAAENKKQKLVLSGEFAEKYPLQILIVEDNPVNEKLVIRILNKLGYQEIGIAHNGVEAVEKFTTKFYEIILMDVQMPEMDGLEATRRIRTITGKCPVIIATTADAVQGDRAKCISAGMDDYISKPIKLEIVANVLEKWALGLKPPPTLHM